MSYKTHCSTCGCELNGSNICWMCSEQKNEKQRLKEATRETGKTKPCSKCGKQLEYDYSGLCQDCYEQAADEHYIKLAEG